MMDLGGLILYIRKEPSLHLSDVQRQIIVNRLSFEPTEREYARARDQVVGKQPAPASS